MLAAEQSDYRETAGVGSADCAGLNAFSDDGEAVKLPLTGTSPYNFASLPESNQEISIQLPDLKA